jgi:hypothetical protein
LIWFWHGEVLCSHSMGGSWYVLKIIVKMWT